MGKNVRSSWGAPLTRITTGRKTLDGYQRNGPNQSRFSWRPTSRAEQTIRPGVFTPAGWHIGVVELLPVHAAPIKINNAIGHQVGHGDFQRVLFLEQFFRDPDSIGRVDQHAQLIAIELDARAFGDASQIERPVANSSPRRGERDRIDACAGESLICLAVEISPRSEPLCFNGGGQFGAAGPESQGPFA